MVEPVLAIWHDRAGHNGVTTTAQHLLERFYFPNLASHVAKWCPKGGSTTDGATTRSASNGTECVPVKYAHARPLM